MLILTFSIIIFKNQENRFFFANGSGESLMKLIEPNFYFQITLFLFCTILWFKLMLLTNLKNLILFLFLFFVWIINGRTIGVLPFPNGNVKLGWFYFETNEFDVCVNQNTDCQTIMDYQTVVKENIFWIIKIKNKEINKNFFVGPIIWNKTMKIFGNEFGKGKFTGKAK